MRTTRPGLGRLHLGYGHVLIVLRTPCHINGSTVTQSPKSWLQQAIVAHNGIRGLENACETVCQGSERVNNDCHSMS